jgi:hypothetical protein
VLREPPTREAALAGCRGSGNDVEVDALADASAPLVVLEEIHLHGNGTPQPTIAVWADGHVVFSTVVGEKFEHLDGEMPSAAAAQLARDVFVALEGVARDTDVEKDYSSDGGQVTRIVVRTGGHWRSASVYGDYRDDFLRVAQHETPEGTEPTAPITPGTFTLVPGDIGVTRILPPMGFATAYQRLIASMPARGTKFAPYSFDLTLFAPEKASESPLPDLAWPLELPAPPDDLRPERCDSYKTDGCPYALDVEYREAAAKFRERLVVNNKVRVVNANGKRFMVNFHALYRGQHAVNAVTECARELVRRARAAPRAP